MDATRIATSLLGDAIGANLFMQRGAVPLRHDSLLKAIELNGVAVAMNLAAFAWSRRAAIDMPQVERQAAPALPVVVQMPRSLNALIEDRAAFLTRYQDADYAASYREFVAKVRIAEQASGQGESLAREVARNLFKLNRSAGSVM